MQSDHASACFVRVGRWRLGSILGSILESFWEPSSLLYSFLGALAAETGSQQRVKKRKAKNPRKPAGCPLPASRGLTGLVSRGP